MSMQKLHGIRNMGAYTVQRSMLEHLLLIEEIILREMPNINEIPNERERITQQLKEYKEQHHINKSFDIEDIQHYLLATTEREMSVEKSQIRGIYTSALIEQTEGNQPITINMLGQRIDHLLYTINTPRHITINNTKGDQTGAWAGSDHGIAHLTINNTTGDWTGEHAGSFNGHALIVAYNTSGSYTGVYAGSQLGNAYLIINNTEGDQTGAHAGLHGNAIIVAHNNKGENAFLQHEGSLVLKNPDSLPRIEGVDDKQKNDILELIDQNAPPEQIMAYLRGNT